MDASGGVLLSNASGTPQRACDQAKTRSQLFVFRRKAQLHLHLNRIFAIKPGVDAPRAQRDRRFALSSGHDRFHASGRWKQHVRHSASAATTIVPVAPVPGCPSECWLEPRKHQRGTGVQVRQPGIAALCSCLSPAAAGREPQSGQGDEQTNILELPRNPQPQPR